MIENSTIRDVLQKYLTRYPDEAEGLRVVNSVATDGELLASRKTLPLHLTCGVAVQNAETGRVLSIHHRVLDRWLLPGGHAEPEDATLEGAAVRELAEEASLFVQPHELELVDIDVHDIPASDAKDEPAHLHVDFRFRATVRQADPVTLQLEEVTGFEWIEPARLSMPRIAQKLAQVSEA
jgi:8-oxo-dGTP pyrophosphatase MutT (NUDIX family)